MCDKQRPVKAIEHGDHVVKIKKKNIIAGDGDNAKSSKSAKEECHLDPDVIREFHSTKKNIIKSIDQVMDSMIIDRADTEIVRRNFAEIRRNMALLEDQERSIMATPELPVLIVQEYAGMVGETGQRVRNLRHDVFAYVKTDTMLRAGSGSHYVKSVRSISTNQTRNTFCDDREKQLVAARQKIAALDNQLASTRRTQDKMQRETSRLQKHLEQEESEGRGNSNATFVTIDRLSNGTGSYRDSQTSLPAIASNEKVEHFLENTNSSSGPVQPAGHGSADPTSVEVTEHQNTLRASSFTQETYSTGNHPPPCSMCTGCRHATKPITRIPPVKLWVFEGDETEYLEWEIAFKALVEDRVECVHEKMNLLKQHLGEEQQKMVRSYYLLDNTEASYQRAIAPLKERYGNPIVISQSLFNRLKSWHPVRKGDKTGLREFSNYLLQVAEAKKQISELNILDYASNVYTEKLPQHLLDKWQSRLRSYKEEMENAYAHPPFEIFVQFVKSAAQTINDPEFRVLDNDRRSSEKNTAKGIFQRQNNSQAKKSNVSLWTSAEPTTKGCDHCEKEYHHISECRQFETLSYEDRNKIIWEKYLCFGCGNKCSQFHKSKTCKNRLKCKKCGKHHMTSMHKANKSKQRL